MTFVNRAPFVRQVENSVSFGITADVAQAADDGLETIFRALLDALVEASAADVEFVEVLLRYPGERAPDAALVERLWRHHFAGNVPLIRIETGGAGEAELTGTGCLRPQRPSREPIFAGYDRSELDWQYSPILWESGVADTLAGWRRRGREHLRRRDVQVDLRYGAAENAVLDLYLPGGDEPRPLAIFLHGGYWQMMDKADHGHFTRGLLDAGFAVAVLNYSLCPDVALADIVAQMDEARSWLHSNAQVLGYRDSGAVVIGHSAGAHLGAMMCAGARGEPSENFIGGLLGISGLYDLTPLLLMPVASTLGLHTVDGFRGVNPISLTPPAGLRAIVALGAEESSEFRLQSEQFAERWASHLDGVTSFEVPGVAHFGVMEHLVEGVLLDAALELLGLST